MTGKGESRSEGPFIQTDLEEKGKLNRKTKEGWKLSVFPLVSYDIDGWKERQARSGSCAWSDSCRSDLH